MIHLQNIGVLYRKLQYTEPVITIQRQHLIRMARVQAFHDVGTTIRDNQNNRWPVQGSAPCVIADWYYSCPLSHRSHRLSKVNLEGQADLAKNYFRLVPSLYRVHIVKSCRCNLKLLSNGLQLLFTHATWVSNVTHVMAARMEVSDCVLTK
jgi:hypothetical protein